MARVSQSKILRNVLFRIYEGFTKDYRAKVSFDTYYESEMNQIINDYKKYIG